MDPPGNGGDWRQVREWDKMDTSAVSGASGRGNFCQVIYCRPSPELQSQYVGLWGNSSAK